MALSPDTGPVPVATGMWSRIARAHLDAVLADTSVAPRLVILGSARSGKSVLLRRIETRLRSGIDGSTDPLRSAVYRTRFVDDAHLLNDSEIDELDAHLDIEGTGLVLSGRTWPRSERLRSLVHRLEPGNPAIVLGHLDERDILTRLQAAGRVIPPECVSALVTMCGSVAWLIMEALTSHGDGRCDDPSHERVSRALGEIVAERLRTIDPDVAASVIRISLGASARGEDEIAHGHAEGLLRRSGQSIPVVRAAVLTATPATDIIELLDGDEAPLQAPDLVESLGDVTDARLARALITHAEAIAPEDADRALELFEAARAAGGDAVEIAMHTSRLAWDRGEIEEAASIIDALTLRVDDPHHDAAVDLSGSIWAARGYIGVSAASYRAHEVRDPLVRTHGAIAAFAAGNPNPLRESLDTLKDTYDVPTTRSVSSRLLLRGLASSLSATPTAALDELIRASDTYTDSRETGPAPEVPAVIAALTAVACGELAEAHAILRDALRRGHGGPWARVRLLLWAAWVSVHLQLPDETTARLSEIDANPTPPRGRDLLLRDAVILAFARRYGASGELPALWEQIRDDVRRVEPDLFSLHALAEFVVAAAQLGEASRFDGALASFRHVLAGLGNPPLWSAHLIWALFQRAVVGGDLVEADEAARELAALPQHTPMIQALSAAATAWLRTRQDRSVDTSVVTDAVQRLAACGLAWDAARLAHLGAAHVRSRKGSAELLALAHALHPNVELAPDLDRPQPVRTDAVLSAREKEVAVLVLDGKTYAEIGEKIFISPRTAEHHIARIRRRLGATSRADLMAKLRSIVESDDETD
ncbi:LuxR C-terminal-related transcriptional regulator [Microbacterium sp.]|uniref:helix-turn-helix transcriptional regulator n=1 Tax=Microbacterium sp. TaxID=51671 RepID=UPI003735F8CF